MIIDFLSIASGCLEGSEIPLDVEEVRRARFSLSRLQKQEHHFEGLCFIHIRAHFEQKCFEF